MRQALSAMTSSLGYCHFFDPEGVAFRGISQISGELFRHPGFELRAQASFLDLLAVVLSARPTASDLRILRANHDIHPKPDLQRKVESHIRTCIAEFLSVQDLACHVGLDLSAFAHSNARLFVPDQVSEPLGRITHLGIGAHQDDLEFMAFHGILACFRSREKWFVGVTCTDGAGSSRTGDYAEFTDEEMQRLRIREQEAAAVVEPGRWPGRVRALVEDLVHFSGINRTKRLAGPEIRAFHVLGSEGGPCARAEYPAFRHVVHVDGDPQHGG
jgi:hypothetical protein